MKARGLAERTEGLAHLRALLRLQPRTYASIALGKQSSQDTHLHSYLHSFWPPHTGGWSPPPVEREASRQVAVQLPYSHGPADWNTGRPSRPTFLKEAKACRASLDHEESFRPVRVLVGFEGTSLQKLPGSTPKGGEHGSGRRFYGRDASDPDAIWAIVGRRRTTGTSEPPMAQRAPEMDIPPIKPAGRL